MLNRTLLLMSMENKCAASYTKKQFESLDVEIESEEERTSLSGRSRLLKNGESQGDQS